jgi:hypothetical protein
MGGIGSDPDANQPHSLLARDLLMVQQRFGQTVDTLTVLLEEAQELDRG